MNLRPCIDIHQGQVKQIIGSTLTENDATLQTNFIAQKSAADFAEMYRRDGLTGGHLICLDRSPETRFAAIAALKSYPNGLQIGGGITDQNAKTWIEAGADKVILTSFIFTDGQLDFDKLAAIRSAVGRERIVFDLACRQRDDQYIIVTNRWQDFTDTIISTETLAQLSEYCSEFLLHGVDQEGKSQGIDLNLIKLITDISPHPVTYAGGISSIEDIENINIIGQGKIDFTVGTALDIFGGSMKYRELVKKYSNKSNVIPESHRESKTTHTS